VHKKKPDLDHDNVRSVVKVKRVRRYMQTRSRLGQTARVGGVVNIQFSRLVLLAAMAAIGGTECAAAAAWVVELPAGTLLGWKAAPGATCQRLFEHARDISTSCDPDESPTPDWSGIYVQLTLEQAVNYGDCPPLLATGQVILGQACAGQGCAGYAGGYVFSDLHAPSTTRTCLTPSSHSAKPV
jgi:hypothetical protein